MRFTINHAILHILNGNEAHYSNEELDIDSDICYAFITKHIKKLKNDASAKEAVFNADSEMFNIVSSYIKNPTSFREFSVSVCEKMLLLIRENENINPADMLIVQYDEKGQKYIAIIKLNYKECFTHKIGIKGNGEKTDNQIVNIPSLDSGKIENACLIPYDPMLLNVLEKPCEINGTPVNYFSELYLDCDVEMSKKEAVQIISDISTEINSKHFSDSINVESKIKVALIEEAIEEDGMISMQSVATKVFDDNEEICNEFIELAKDAGLVQDVHLGEKYTKQQFSTTKFKADNGIELKLPTGISDDPNIVELIENSDGSVSIILKNLRRAY